jgi:hypothetical protein
MAYRSWLKDVRHISDLGEHLHAIPYDKLNGDRAFARDDKWLEILKRPIPVDDEFKQYYGSRMHDSGLLGIERLGDELHVMLSCDFTYCFAEWLADWFEIELETNIWPLTLVLTDVVYMNCVRYMPAGELRWADWKKFRQFVDISDCDSFLHDWFHEQDQRYQWIAELWSLRSVRQKLSSSMFLMADCTGFCALDGRRKAIEKAFAPTVVPIWEDLWIGKSVKGEPVERWDWYNGIETCLSARMMCFDDLRRPSVKS